MLLTHLSKSADLWSNVSIIIINHLTVLSRRYWESGSYFRWYYQMRNLDLRPPHPAPVRPHPVPRPAYRLTRWPSVCCSWCPLFCPAWPKITPSTTAVRRRQNAWLSQARTVSPWGGMTSLGRFTWIMSWKCRIKLRLILQISFICLVLNTI